MDQLNEYLFAHYKGRYFSALLGQSFLVLGDKEDYQPKISLYTIPLPKEQIDINIVKDNLLKSDFYIITYRLSRQIGIPFFTIVFPENVIREEDALFILSSDGFRNPRIVDSSELERVLLNELHLKKADVPAKEVNKHVADFFHQWSREHLPSGERGIIKCDIDGLFVDESQRITQILVEIKRSAIPKIPQWKPYQDDYSGLNLLRVVAKRLNSRFWIMHHEGVKFSSSSKISIFEVNPNLVIDNNAGPSYVGVYNPIMLKDIDNLL